jgi:hypothetical protein
MITFIFPAEAVKFFVNLRIHRSSSLIKSHKKNNTENISFCSVLQSRDDSHADGRTRDYSTLQPKLTREAQKIIKILHTILKSNRQSAQVAQSRLRGDEIKRGSTCWLTVSENTSNEEFSHMSATHGWQTRAPNGRFLFHEPQMLYLIGLGLGDEKDITVKGLEAVRKCTKVFLEAYTSILGVNKEKLVHSASNDLEKISFNFFPTNRNSFTAKKLSSPIANLLKASLINQLSVLLRRKMWLF